MNGIALKQESEDGRDPINHDEDSDNHAHVAKGLYREYTAIEADDGELRCGHGGYSEWCCYVQDLENDSVHIEENLEMRIPWREALEMTTKVSVRWSFGNYSHLYPVCQLKA